MVSIITCTMRDASINNVFQNYERQSISNKELIIIINKDQISLHKWRDRAKKYKNVRVMRMPESVTLGDCLNFGVKKSRYSYIAKFDDDDFYAKNYLKTMLVPFQNKSISVVGKASIYIYYRQSNLLSLHLPGKEKQFSNHVAGATLVIKKSVFNEVMFSDINEGSDQEFLGKCVKQGLKIYSADRFNFACIRQSNKDLHTWKLSDEELLKYGEFVEYTKNYRHLVVR